MGGSVCVQSTGRFAIARDQQCRPLYQIRISHAHSQSAYSLTSSVYSMLNFLFPCRFKFFSSKLPPWPTRSSAAMTDTAAASRRTPPSPLGSIITHCIFIIKKIFAPPRNRAMAINHNRAGFRSNRLLPRSQTSCSFCNFG